MSRSTTDAVTSSFIIAPSLDPSDAPPRVGSKMHGSDYLRRHDDMQTRALYGSAVMRSYVLRRRSSERVLARLGSAGTCPRRSLPTVATRPRTAARRRRVRLAPQRRRHARAVVPGRLRASRGDAPCGADLLGVVPTASLRGRERRHTLGLDLHEPPPHLDATQSRCARTFARNCEDSETTVTTPAPRPNRSPRNRSRGSNPHRPTQAQTVVEPPAAARDEQRADREERRSVRARLASTHEVPALRDFPARTSIRDLPPSY